jgi:hypothetical protein
MSKIRGEEKDMSRPFKERRPGSVFAISVQLK